MWPRDLHARRARLAGRHSKVAMEVESFRPSTVRYDPSGATAFRQRGYGTQMANPPVAGSEAATEREILLATKLNVPVPGPDLVPRRLAEQLDEGVGRGVVLVCAPAGYGKTVLLAGWARQVRYPVGWLSLDAGDNDPARFWRHAVAALDRARPGIAARVGPLLRAAPAAVDRRAGHGTDQRAGRPERRGRGGAGPRRLPRGALRAGPRVAGVLAGAPAARAGCRPGQPRGPADAAGPVAGPRAARRGPRGRPAIYGW